MLRSSRPPLGESVSMWAYPVLYALPVQLDGVLRDRTVTVPCLPDSFDGTWVLSSEEGLP